MAGRGPAPKPAALRQRKNKPTFGNATLPTAESSSRNRVPPLPNRAEGWHPMLLEWWSSVWRSPMAAEFLESDMRGGLYQLAYLHQAFWECTEFGMAAMNKLPSLAAEIRLQEVRFGLSPIDRRRLQWTIEQGETAAEKTAARRVAKTAARRKPAGDPRNVLKAI